MSDPYNITTAVAKGGVAHRAAVNAALQLLASNNLGEEAPTTPYVGMFQWLQSGSTWTGKVYTGVEGHLWATILTIDTSTEEVTYGGISEIEAATVLQVLAGAVTDKYVAPSTLNAELVKNLAPTVNAAVNKLDIFTKSGGAVPDLDNVITVAIPDGNGYTFRTRSGAYLSGTSQIVMADGASYWSKGGTSGEIVMCWLYAIWDGTGIVWALGGYSGFLTVPLFVTSSCKFLFLGDKRIGLLDSSFSQKALSANNTPTAYESPKCYRCYDSGTHFIYTTDPSADFDFDGDFMLTARVTLTSLNSSIMGSYSNVDWNSASAGDWALIIDGDGYVDLVVKGQDTVIGSSYTCTNSVWYDIVVKRVSNTVTIYVKNDSETSMTVAGSGTISGTIGNTQVFRLGRAIANLCGADVYLSDISVWKGSFPSQNTLDVRGIAGIHSDHFFLLEDGSTYQPNTSHLCVAVAKVRYEYNTADTPDHTIQSTGENAPQVIWNPKSDYGKMLYLAADITLASDIADFNVISGMVKQSGRYYIFGTLAWYVLGGLAIQRLRVGDALYVSATVKAFSPDAGSNVAYPTTTPAQAEVYLNAGDSVHLGAGVWGGSGNKMIYGLTQSITTMLSFRRVD